MSEFETGKGEFKHLTREQRRSFLNSLLDIVDHYNQISFIGVAEPVTESKRPVRDSYIKGLTKVIPRAVQEARLVHNGAVHLVFAKHPELSFERIGKYCDRLTLAMPFLRGCTGQEPQDCPPLQLADIVAFEVSHLTRDKQRYSMTRLRARHSFNLYPPVDWGWF